jgi:hypothetical protein
MMKKLRQLAGLAVLAALSATLATTTAGATTAPVSVEVSGTQTTVDEANGTSAMHGSLVGVWQITKFVPRYASASRFVMTADEEFTGCLDSDHSGACDKQEPSGKLKFIMMYWATFDPATGALLHGNCVHPVVGGSGSFRKAAGVIFMDDTPTAGGVVTTYTGVIDYQARKSGQAAAHRHLASAVGAAGHGQSGTCGS